MNSIQIKNEEIKLPLFTDEMTAQKNAKESTKGVPRKLKVHYLKKNKNQLYFYILIDNQKLKFKKIPFTIA